MKKEKFVVAVKDISFGDIRPGKILGAFRELDFAERDKHRLANREALPVWKVGIFQNGKLLT